MAVYFALSCLFIITITFLLNRVDENINRLIYNKTYGGQSQDATLTSNHKNLSYFMSFQFNCTTQAAMQPSSYQLNPSIRKLASYTQSHYIHSANINNMIGSGGLVQQNNRIHQTSSNLNFQTQRQNLQNNNIMNENSIYYNSHRVSNNLNNNLQQESVNINSHSSNNFLFNKNVHNSVYQNVNLQSILNNKNGTVLNPKIVQANSSKTNFQQSIRKNSRMLSNQNGKIRVGQKNKFSSLVGFGMNVGCPNCGSLSVEDSIIQQQNINQSPQLMKSNTVKKTSTLSKTKLSMINDESIYFPDMKQQTIFEEQISSSLHGLPVQILNSENTFQTLNHIQKQINIPFKYLIISSQEKKIEIVETNNEDTKKFISEMHIDELTVSLEKFIKMFFDPKYKDILSKNYHICQNQRTSTIYKMIIQDQIQFDNGFLPSPKSKAHHMQTTENNLSENLNLQSQLQQLQQQQQQQQSQQIQLFPQLPAFQKKSSHTSLSKKNSIVYSMNQNQNIQNLKVLSHNIAIFYFIEVTDVYKEIQENINVNNTADKEGYKDDLLATVTHDLKNPLNGMVQMLDLCEKEIINQKDITQQSQLNLEKIKEFLSIAQKNTQLLLFLVHDIQDFYQHSKRKLRLVSEQVKIDELINELNSLFLPQVKLKGIELVFISKLCNDYIYTDGFRLKQIMINLISNAIKYTSKGGVTVSFSNTNKQELFKISISDTGSGIPDNIKNELFKLYQTFDNKKGENPRGVGLGLVISQKLVQEMGPSKQQIQLTSQKDKGTTFSFVIFLNLQDKHIYNYCDANSVMSIKTEGCSIEDQEIQQDYKNQENETKQKNQFTEESEQENYHSKNILENTQIDTKQYISHANIPLVSDRFYNMNDLKNLGNKIKQLNSLIQTPSGILFNQKSRFNSSFTNVSQNYDGIITNNIQNDHQNSISSQQISLTPKSIQESERNIKTNFEYKFRYNKSPFRNINNPNELSPPPQEQGYIIQGILSNNQSIKSGQQKLGNTKSFIKNVSTNSQQNQIQAFQSEINQSELFPSSSKTLYNAIILNENLKQADKIDIENNIQHNNQLVQQNQQLQSQNLQKSRTPTQKRLNSNGNISSNFTTTLQNPKQNHKKAVRKLSSSYYINNIPQDQSALHSPQMEQNSNEQFIGQLRQLGVKSVLIVDDEPFNIYVMLQTLDFLQKNEFLLEKAYNGKEAADLVQSNPKGYQLIFIDSNMPVMKGAEAIQLIKSINQEIIIVMISGDSRMDEIQSAQQSGADGFLSKPVKLQHIKKEINKIFMQLNQNNLQMQNVYFSSQSELLL